MIRMKKKHADAPLDSEKLQAYVKRIEAVEELIVAERDARTDIYTEVKASGMKPNMVRKIIRERAKKAIDEAEEAELERYRAALAMPGATYRSVASKMNVPRSTLHRLVPREENGTEHDSETGEITTAVLDTQRGEGSERADITTASGASLASDAIDLMPYAGVTGTQELPTHGQEVARAAPPTLGAVGAKPRVASDNDWPEMPAGLRRVRA